MKKKFYEIPQVDVVELIPEGCVAASGEAGTEDVDIVSGFEWDAPIMF